MTASSQVHIVTAMTMAMTASKRRTTVASLIEVVERWMQAPYKYALKESGPGRLGEVGLECGTPSTVTGGTALGAATGTGE
jgi:hypothetical protein